ncbi:zinc-binding dehydrogenase family oxidoreductase [Novosphingobium sp. PY1]|nr:zinc-binding dehydrogenase family oxidoreductase [Novosphingobium sp. PY1]
MPGDETMKAIVQDRAGDPGVLAVRQVPTPSLRSDDVLIRVERSGVCYHDVLVRQGVFRKAVQMPLIPGHEVAGIVERVGPAVSDFVVGDRICTTQRRAVCGRCRLCRSGRETLCEAQEFMGDAHLNGGYSQYVAVAQDCAVKVPADVSLDHAAIAACAIGTQLNAIRDVGRLKAGETVLVTGASGTQGGHGVQLARAMGARVLATVSSETAAKVARDHGAHDVIVTPHGIDFSRQVREATAGAGVDMVVDNVGTDIFHFIRRAVARGGRWVMVGALSGKQVSFNTAQLFTSGIDMLSAVSCSRAQLADCLQLLADGAVKPVIADVVALDDAAAAHRRLECGGVGGKILLHV